MSQSQSSARAPHLAVHEHKICAGEEWKHGLPGWLFLQVRSGVGYCLDRQGHLELPAGSVLVLSPRAEASIRASQLGDVELSLFRVEPELLTGILTLGEQLFLAGVASQPEYARRLLGPGHALALRFRELAQFAGRRDLVYRLALVNMFALVFAEVLEEHARKEQTPNDARQRLRQLLARSSAAEWVNLSFEAVVQEVSCTPRHLSRVFREVAGMSFREKQARVRLARASELLRQTDVKVIDVALESGFQSLSLFNQMFRRHFGLSPTQWRKQRQKKADAAFARRKAPWSVSEPALH